MTPSSQEVTQWLVDWSNGDSAALERLIPMVHEELGWLARRYMRQERGRERHGVMLQTTALAKIDERKSREVELRFFRRLSVEETAFALEVSPETILRDWRLAKSWHLHELDGRTGYDS